MYSMARPSRLVRESATTMRYCGLRILPIRRSRIFTATVCSLLSLIDAERSGRRRGVTRQWAHGLASRPRLEGAGRAPDTSKPLCQIAHRGSHQEVVSAHDGTEIVVQAGRRRGAELVRGQHRAVRAGLVEGVGRVQDKDHLVPE